MKQRKFKKEVIDTFRLLTGKTFTIGDALNVYLSTPTKIHSESKSARQFVHRNILRFVSSADIVQVKSEGRAYTYKITEQFSARIAGTNAPEFPKKEDLPIPNNALGKNLTERLHQQKLMLLTAMGEAEEYDAIYKELPEIGAQIQDLYNESRDRCSKLLGKVKAIENLIALSGN
ncbi:hypothetical protein [Undibacterium baiyunense]|uniref:Response regulator n=1 Tax=Undibacterium baiyunense TaxID=2828731 RepID=A0A941DDZ5_9BURK|nr:hypothetical protein [Undibacterium baiyunense]MBR7745217.1 hypothetical protein [Undibacterium baiyunense]